MQAAVSPGGRRALGGFFWLLVLFLYAPIAVLLVFSFNDSLLVSLPLSGFTTRWYRALLENQELITSLETSLLVAAVSSAIAVGLGVFAAFALVRHDFKMKGASSALLLSPLVIPYVVFGIALLILFSALDDFLIPRFGIYFGFGIHTIVIGHVVVSIPYTLLTIMPRLEKLGVTVEEAARDLGASAWSTFRRVTLPLLTPAVVSAYLIAFTLSFDEYAIASFLAGTQPTWPVYLFAQLRVPSLLPQLVAVSSIVLIASVLLVGAAEVGRRVAEHRYAGSLPEAG